MSDETHDEVTPMIPSGDPTLDQLLRFTVEVDKMTGVERHTLVTDGSRRENDAEHSWHIALMALLFKDYFPEPVNIERAAAICIAHDLIEIYAGDTFAFDAEANKDKAAREEASANRLFGMLPESAGSYLRSLWNEFEAMETPESRFANCMDRIQPFLHNTVTNGHTWKEGNVAPADIHRREAPVEENMPALKPWIDACIQVGLGHGWIQG